MRSARRDRGFSLLVVLMLITVMGGVAATVILSTQRDLSVAGQDRDELQAFYAAEYGVAAAKDWLASAKTETCAAGPLAGRAMTALDGATRFTFCIHDDRDGVRTIEAWGVAGAAKAHLSVDVAAATLRTVAWWQR